MEDVAEEEQGRGLVKAGLNHSRLMAVKLSFGLLRR